jgi:hypothetical protein
VTKRILVVEDQEDGRSFVRPDVLNENVCKHPDLARREVAGRAGVLSGSIGPES